MDEMIVKITGAVKHPIMIDPGVWIFDERRVDMDKVFDEEEKSIEEKDFAAMGRAFDEQRKGVNPQTNGNKVTISKKDLTEKSLGIHLTPFIVNAEPESHAERVIVQRINNQEVILPLDKVKTAIAAFSHKGAPLKENGPIHLYMADGSNRYSPITGVTGFTIL
ncbi:hypothetical protein [Alkalicoccus daliensis]|uniref:Peptidyl-prolyl cis-trans isomerase n=1 Tax=Alkalicoccus daliensis TaxID=745820 RepID=A0A1G9ZTY0_9BACI|nr:hypothetical protein [Alkalicoccus daliensis]SDN23986.1 hypothetical protein SAMN04488053_101215 [Alkalicoccus daliensis]